MVQMLYKLSRKVWMKENPPKDWSKMIVTQYIRRETDLTQLTTGRYLS